MELKDIDSLIEKLTELNDQISDVNTNLDNLKAERAQIKNEIISLLKSNDIDGVSSNGKNVQIVKKRQYSILDIDGFLKLDDYYHTSALPSINSMRLNSFLKDLEDNNGGVLPDDIAATVKGYEYEDVSMRKAR